MTPILPSSPDPLTNTESCVSAIAGKVKCREIISDIALLALNAVSYISEVGSSLRLKGISEKGESKAPLIDKLEKDFDDDSSDDGFSDYDDPSYQSCIIREPRPLDVERASGSFGSRTSSNTTFPLPPLPSDRSESSSDVSSERASVSSLKAVNSKHNTESTIFNEFQIVSGSFTPHLLPLLPQAFASGRLIPSSAGKNGSCRLFDDSGKCIAIFKPKEGELGFALDPTKETKYLRSKEGLEPGEGALSEYITFRINQILHLIDIPSTSYIKVSSRIDCKTKEGSLHEFIPGARNYADLSSEEKALLSKEQVEALAIFDLFIFNADRNEENLLILNKPKGGMEIIGIDHGCILPRSARSGGVFCWSELEQAKSPITPKSMASIHTLSSMTLRALQKELEEEGFESASMESFSERLLTQEAAIHMLKHGASLGLSLSEIAIFFQDSLPAINPLHKIIFSSQKKSKSEKVVILDIQTQVETLLTTYLSLKNQVRSSGATELKDLDKICVQQTIAKLNLYAY